MAVGAEGWDDRLGLQQQRVGLGGRRVVAGLGRMPVRFSVAGEPLLLRFSHDLWIMGREKKRSVHLCEKKSRIVTEKSILSSLENELQVFSTDRLLAVDL